MKKRVFLYVRVSTLEQANEGYSIKEQESRLRAYAESKDYQIIKVYTDAGQTGANLNRPAMQEMIKNITSVDLVLVYKLDRLSRSQKDTLYLIEDVFLKNGVDFASLNESFDTSTPFGRAMIGILSVFAQLEREQIKERTHTGRIGRAKDGYYHGGSPNKAPTGYDYIDGKLVVNEYEAACVKFIFNEYLKGKGQGKIFEDVEKKYPNIIANESTIRKILVRPIYKGVIIFDKQEYKGRHTPLVSEKNFDEVQGIISKKASKYRKDSNVNYILSGLLYCGYCGARLSGKAGKKLKSGETMKYYICYSRRGTPKHMMTADNCIKKFERKEKLEEEILNRVKKINIEMVESSINNRDSSDELTALSNKVKEIDKQISKLVDLFTVGTIPIDILNSKMDGLNEDKEKLLVHIDQLQSNDISNFDEAKDAVSQIEDMDNLSDGEKQILLTKLINRITLYNDDIVWELSF